MNGEDPALVKTNEQIEWLLARANVSSWLKNALSAARGRDPVALLNDLSILDCVLRLRCNAQIRTASEKFEQSSWPVQVGTKHSTSPEGAVVSAHVL